MTPLFIGAIVLWTYSIVQIYKTTDTKFKVQFTFILIAMIAFFVGLNLITLK